LPPLSLTGFVKQTTVDIRYICLPELQCMTITKVFAIATGCLMLMNSCKKEDIIPANNLIDNYSFEENGVFSTTGWDINNITYSTIVPENGDDFSIKIFQDTIPDEGYAEFLIEGYSGEHTVTFTCQANAFGGITGNVKLRIESTGETGAEIANATYTENVWGEINLTATAIFSEGDKLIVHLGAGSGENPVATQFMLYDLATLVID
jgi:hypothetical protein